MGRYGSNTCRFPWCVLFTVVENYSARFLYYLHIVPACVVTKVGIVYRKGLKELLPLVICFICCSSSLISLIIACSIYTLFIIKSKVYFW